MTEPDQPYRRPRPDAEHDADGKSSLLEGSTSSSPPMGDDPVILDPEFHQSVWKPWQEPAEASPLDSDQHGSPSSRARGLGRTVIMWLGIGAMLALVAALLIPQLMQTPTWRLVPLVEDLPSEPQIAWSVDAGEPCAVGMGNDHAVMYTPKRVWSLDLRNGRTRWSVDLPGDSETVNCLPGANMVAVSDVDRFENTVIRISLLDGSTGRKIDELPGETTAQVIPLGAAIGLIDRSNMLRAVKPGKLDDPLWSQRLPGEAEDLTEIHVQDVDDTTVQLWYSSEGESFMPVLSLRNGQAPPWAQASWTDAQYYYRLSDVVLWYRFSEESTVVDLDGRELWSAGNGNLTVSGSRLYATSASSTGSDSSNQDLREVDPRSGEPLNDHVFTGPFHLAVAAPQDRVAVFQSDSMMILDKDLQPQHAVPSIDYPINYMGQKFFYTGGDMHHDSSAGRARLTAIDPVGSRVIWEFALESGQHISQLGRHLVVMDNGGRTIHGLRSRS